MPLGFLDLTGVPARRSSNEVCIQPHGANVCSLAGPDNAIASSFGGNRELELKAGAAGLAFVAEDSAQLGDEALGDIQAEAGGVALALGGEEGLEDALGKLGGDAGAVVDDFQGDPVRRLDGVAGAGFGGGLAVEAEGDGAALDGGGLAGVAHDLEDGGAEPGEVGSDEGEVVGEIELEGGPGIAEGVDRGLEGAQDFHEIELAPDDGGGADERVGAVHQLGGGDGAVLDLGEAVADGVIERFVVEHEPDVAVKKGQDVVHPVGQATDQLVLELRLFDLHGVPAGGSRLCAAGGGGSDR